MIEPSMNLMGSLTLTATELSEHLSSMNIDIPFVTTDPFTLSGPIFYVFCADIKNAFLWPKTFVVRKLAH